MKLYHLFWDDGYGDDVMLLGTYSSEEKRQEARRRFNLNGYLEHEDQEGQYILQEGELDKDDEDLYCDTDECGL